MNKLKAGFWFDAAAASSGRTGEPVVCKLRLDEEELFDSSVTSIRRHGRAHAGDNKSFVGISAENA